MKTRELIFECWGKLAGKRRQLWARFKRHECALIGITVPLREIIGETEATLAAIVRRIRNQMAKREICQALEDLQAAKNALDNFWVTSAFGWLEFAENEIWRAYKAL